MLANSSVQLLFGRIYKFYSTKWVFLTAIGLFEIGSLICGLAPNSNTLIVGRAIAGVGSAGIFSGGMMILFHTIPLHKRPVYFGLFAAISGTASVVGPLLGGVFTEKATWRWCFYINLPVGAIAICVISFILKVPSPKGAGLTVRAKLSQLDPLGTLCFVPSMICLILALQWGGTAYDWGDRRIVALLVVFGVLLVAFIGIQFWKGENGTVPPRIISQRSISFGVFFTFCNAASMMIFLYYLPIWFQAIKGVSAVTSGIMTIPLVISLVISSFISGAATQRIGYYVPAMIISPTIMSIGAGLITTFKPDTDNAGWIGYQVLFGLGLGAGMQAPNLAAQAVLNSADVAIGVALVMFAQQLGGAIFISVAGNIFTTHLLSSFSQIPESSSWIPSTIINMGATDLRNAIPAQYLDIALVDYNSALVRCFDVGLAMACVMIIGALGMEWKNIKLNKGALKDSPEGSVKEPAT
jgi:MFS family permease